MQCAVHNIDGDVHVDLEGHFTFNDSDIFAEILRTLGPYNEIQPLRCIHMNIENLIAIDSSALAMLLRLCDLAKKCRSRLVFNNPQGQVKHRLDAAAQYNNGLVIVY